MHAYCLTRVGWGLTPTLEALGTWVERLLRRDTGCTTDAGALLRQLARSLDVDQVPRRRSCIQLVLVAPEAACLSRGGLIRRARVRRAGPVNSDVTVHASTATLDDFYRGRLTWREARTRGAIMLEGDPEHVRTFPMWFAHRDAVEGVDASPV